jgi:hypothetical protein
VKDLAEINFNMSELRKSQHAINLILEVLENDGSYHDSLAFHFNYTLLPMHFVHSTSSFETAEMQYNMRQILPGWFQSGYNFQGKDTFDGSMVPLDFESLKTDREYLYFIKTQQNRTRSHIGYFYENLRKSVAFMISDLEIENPVLKNLEAF